MSTHAIFISLGFIQIINVILRVEFGENAVDVFRGLPTEVCDVQADKLGRHVIVGWHDHLNILLFVIFT